jgi:hypothetical protein
MSNYYSYQGLIIPNPEPLSFSNEKIKNIVSYI